MIKRAPVEFHGPTHTYTLDGEKLLGVSTVAKIGEAADAWGIASAWGWRLGYEGAHALATEHGALRPFDVEFPTKNGPRTVRVKTQDDLREALGGRKMTPWGQREDAQDRGNWTHNVLEALGQEGEVRDVLGGVAPEWRGHATAVLTWYLEYRPSFVAIEVQVASETHGFSGRYDVRCKVSGERFIANNHQTLILQGEERLVDPRETYLCLIDLKTSLRIYPLSHYPQLAGYELASVEMGFPATDAQFVLNTHPDGTKHFKQSYATSEDFVAYLGAMRAIRRLQAEDPEEKLRRAREEEILANLPSISRDLKTDTGPLAGLDGKAIGILCGGLRKRGLVEQDERKVWNRVGS